MPKVYIIILNWNGWRDTIECLESVLRLEYPTFTVIVCDNASSDGSLDRIRAWAAGEIRAEVQNQELASLTQPPLKKPIALTETPARAEAPKPAKDQPRLVLLATGANLGFAGGNNAGLRYALAQGDCEFAWVLNNDTVVRPDALQHLVRRMQQQPGAGICGATLLWYQKPNIIQARGGAEYNGWVARVRMIDGGSSFAPNCPPQAVESRMQYVSGASMFVRRSLLNEIGLMNEDYFLYFEELDWAMRARHRHSLAWSPEAIVYHKEGASIGTARSASARSPVSEFYTARNRIIFTARYLPARLPSVYAAVLASILHRMLLRRWRNSMALLHGLAAGLAASFRRGATAPAHRQEVAVR